MSAIKHRKYHVWQLPKPGPREPSPCEACPVEPCMGEICVHYTPLMKLLGIGNKAKGGARIGDDVIWT